MDDKTYIGQLSELKVMADLAKKGNHIFSQTSGKAPFDLIAYKDGISKRVSVKSTTKLPNTLGKYSIELRRVRSNKTENKTFKIEKNEFDILAVYIHNIDKVIYLDIESVIGKAAINVSV